MRSEREDELNCLAFVLEAGAVMQQDFMGFDGASRAGRGHEIDI